MQGASEQCMQATEIDFSAPTMPSLMVTTRRRFTPQGTSFSFLQAVTQPLHSMQSSASRRTFILAMVVSPPLVLIARRGPSPSSGPLDLADGGFCFLHHRHRIVAVGRGGIDRLAAHDRRRAVGIEGQHVLALPPAREVERYEGMIRTDALGHQGLDLEPGAGRRLHPHVLSVPDAAVVGRLWIDLDEVVLH